MRRKKKYSMYTKYMYMPHSGNFNKLFIGWNETLTFHHKPTSVKASPWLLEKLEIKLGSSFSIIEEMGSG